MSSPGDTSIYGHIDLMCPIHGIISDVVAVFPGIGCHLSSFALFWPYGVRILF